MRQRHIADAELIVVPKEAKAVFNGVSTLDAEQGGDFALTVGGLDFGGGRGEGERFGMPSDDVVTNCIDHVERAMGGAPGCGISRGDIHGEEGRADASLLQTHDVGVGVGTALSDIEPVDSAAGDVVVRVDEQSGPVNFHHLLVGDLAGLCGGYVENGSEEGGKSHSFNVVLTTVTLLEPGDECGRI